MQGIPQGTVFISKINKDPLVLYICAMLQLRKRVVLYIEEYFWKREDAAISMPEIRKSKSCRHALRIIIFISNDENIHSSLRFFFIILHFYVYYMKSNVTHERQTRNSS